MRPAWSARRRDLLHQSGIGCRISAASGRSDSVRRRCRAGRSDRHAHGHGCSLLRCIRMSRAGHRASAHAPAPATRAARTLAGGDRQPRLGGASGNVAARRHVRSGLPRSRAAAAPFARFSAAYRASGRFGDCLDVLKADLADPVGDRVCETVRVAREVGGSDLGSVLRTLSELLRSDARTRSELETRQGWVINAGNPETSQALPGASNGPAGSATRRGHGWSEASAPTWPQARANAD